MAKSRNLGGLEAYFPALYGVIDFFIIWLSAYIAFWIKFEVFYTPAGYQHPEIYQAITLVGSLLIIISATVTKIYGPWRGRRLGLLYLRLTATWAMTFLIIFALLVFMKQAETVSRQWLGMWAITSATFALSFRYLLFSYLSYVRTKGWNRKNVVIIGNPDMALKAKKRLSRAPWIGLDVVSIINLCDDANPGAEISSQNLQGLADVLINENALEVWICLPLSSHHLVSQIMHELRHSLVNIRYVPDWSGFELLNHQVSHVAGLYTLDLSCSPLTTSKQMLKLLEDKVLSTVILILIAPLMAFIALGVKFSSRGPAFYRQERVSWNGDPFMMLKFRTMPVDIEKNSGAIWATKNENRATPFGSFLRKTSLDELPQFLNVFMGEMSIVGPRPERTVFVEKFKDEIPGYMKKHHMKAGVTGWAQVNGWRGDTCLKTRVEHDLHYIEHWSIWLDVKIIFLTLFKGFINKNAY